MILKNAILCDATKNQQSDIQITNGIITRIDSHISDDDDILDCNNQIIMPQFIDCNVFPKNKSLGRKPLISLATKAQNGGVGSIILHSDTTPKIDNEMIVEFVKSINKDLKIDIFPLISSLNNDNKISDISILHSLGGVGINLPSNSSPNTLDKVAKYAKMLDIPIFLSADDDLGGVINYSEISANLGLPARNPLSEIKEVAKFLEVAIFYDIKVVFSAISEPRSVELINQAKQNNPNVFCETSIHHLILDDSKCENYNTSAKLNPPLKSKNTRDKLLEYLSEGKIDLLTSLQCACYNSNKERVFEEAEYGIDAIAYYFSLAFSFLVKRNIIDLQTLSKLTSHNPAQILNLNYGSIEANKEAKLMLVDLEESLSIQDSFLPYHNEHCVGKVIQFI